MSDLYARFVGGPWHNRHVLVKDLDRLAVHIEPELPVDSMPIAVELERVFYFKRLCVLGSGARWYEYICEGCDIETQAGFLSTGGNGKIDRADWLRQRWARQNLKH